VDGVGEFVGVVVEEVVDGIGVMLGDIVEEGIGVGVGVKF